MIHSMTGYGDAQHEEAGVSYAIEVRSLNNRYFKPSIKLPESFQYLESQVDKLLRSRLDRGSVHLSLRVRSTGADAAQEINTRAVESYLRQLASVNSGSLQTTVDLGTILALPGVCQPPEVDETQRAREWSLIERVLGEALTKLITMRSNEGRALRDDMVAQCEAIRASSDRIREKAPEVITTYHKRLRMRVDGLLSEAKLELNEADLIKEVAVYAERCDISEELSRLACHLEQFVRICDEKAQAGRRLEFLSQELLREANTIGSKANDADIARHVVEIKGRIDRLKEQAQNVE